MPICTDQPVAGDTWKAESKEFLQRMSPEIVLNHWPSDVWIGAALGTWGGHTIAKRNEERRHGIPQRKWYDVVHRACRGMRRHEQRRDRISLIQTIGRGGAVPIALPADTPRWGR